MMFFLLSVIMFYKLSLIFIPLPALLCFCYPYLFCCVVFFCSTGHIPISIAVPVDAAVIGSLIILFETLLWEISIYFISFFSKTVLLLGHMSRLACNLSQKISSIAMCAVDPILSVSLITHSLFVFNSSVCSLKLFL